MRFASKQELVDTIEKEHSTLVDLLGSIPRKRWLEAGVWGDDWNIRDLLAHLTEWEQMFLRWFGEGQAGGVPVMPAPGYKWNQTPSLNREIQRRFKELPVPEAVRRFEASYDEVLALAKGLPAPQLLEPGHFAWTGRYPLTTYLAPNTCSHYRFAIKVVKRWLRTQNVDR